MNLDQVELQVLLTEIRADLKALRQDLSEVKIQTLKTNGRVNALELFNAGIQGSKATVIGIVTGLGAALGVVATALSGWLAGPR